MKMEESIVDKKFNTFREKKFFNVLNHDIKRLCRVVEKDTKNDNKYSSALWRNVSRDFGNIFSFSTMSCRRRKGKFSSHNKFSLRMILAQTDYLYTWIFIMFHVEPIFSCFISFRWRRRKIFECRITQKKSLNSLCLFSESFLIYYYRRKVK